MKMWYDLDIWFNWLGTWIFLSKSIKSENLNSEFLYREEMSQNIRSVYSWKFWCSDFCLKKVDCV